MNSLELLDKLEIKLTEDKQIEYYCRDSLAWVRARKLDWESDRIRVGVVGVTSSGKSTLIDAVSGVNILSKAVVPTSGQLVHSMYGTKNTVTIKFADGSTKLLEDDDFTVANLMEYSDTRYNPDNEKGVTSIEITSPTFDLGPNVVLIDSPGLDAYGLEMHEKLTLETMVPSIDVCVYVTTMKANNDSKMRDVLDVLARYECPVIIVQNMLDTIRTSVRGDKSRKDAALEHLMRVKQIVKESDIEDKGRVSIVQMSAEYARQWRTIDERFNTTVEQFAESHYEEFVSYVKLMIERQKPLIEASRKESVRLCISNIDSLLGSRIAGSTVANSTSFEPGDIRKRMNEFSRKQAEDYDRCKAEYIKAAEFIKKSLSDTDKLTNETEFTNMHVKRYGEAVLKLIEDGNKFIEDIAAEVNIPKRDIMKSVSYAKVSDIAVKKRVVTTEKKVPDTGFGAVIKRSLGMFSGKSDIGYHKEVQKRVEIDSEATKKLIEQQIELALTRYSAVYEEWRERNYTYACAKVNKVVNLAKELYSIRKETQLLDESIIRFREELKDMLDMDDDVCEVSLIDIDAEPEVIEASVTDDIRVGYDAWLINSKEVNVTGTLASVIRLSKNAGKGIHNSVARALMTRVGCMSHTPVIVGWDDNCIKEFMWQSGITDAVICVGDEAVNRIERPDEDERRCYFVLANTIQFGAAKKQILNSKVERIVRDVDYIVWVVQDFGELLAGDNIVEGLRSMETFVKDKDALCDSCIWLSHENPIYNLVFLEHQMNPVDTPEKESSLLKECREKYASYINEQVIEYIIAIVRNVNVN